MDNERAILCSLVPHPAAQSRFLGYRRDKDELLLAGRRGSLGFINVIEEAWLAPWRRVDTA